MSEADLAKAPCLRDKYSKWFGDAISCNEDRARPQISVSKTSVMIVSARRPKKGGKKIVGYCHENRIYLPLLFP